MERLHCPGHVRPLTTLSARLVSLRPNVHVTLLTTDGLYDRVKKELFRSFGEGDEAASRVRRVRISGLLRKSFLTLLFSRYRLISIGHIGLLEPDLEGKFAKAWSTLASAEESLVCASSGTSYPVTVKPNAVIIDVRSHFVQCNVTESAHHRHPTISSLLYSIFRLSSPSAEARLRSMRGIPEWCTTYCRFSGQRSTAAREAFASEQKSNPAALGRPTQKLWRRYVRHTERITSDIDTNFTNQIGFGASSEVVRLPGLPPMHDYENTPQDVRDASLS